MAMLREASKARLAAMGIQVWERRAGRSRDAAATGEKAASATVPRIRLAAGSGDWLVVLDGTVPERFRFLVSDITAAIGPERCRFGQWAHSSEAGVAPDEWADRGIEHVLVLGEPRLESERLIAAGDLAVLAADGSARRRLWQRLRRALES